MHIIIVFTCFFCINLKNSIFIFKLTDFFHGPDIAGVEINKYPQINVFYIANITV